MSNRIPTYHPAQSAPLLVKEGTKIEAPPLYKGRVGRGIVIFLFLFLSFHSAHAALILQAPKYIGLINGLVGYWSFNGPDMAGNIAYDRSGQGNDGTLTNDPVRAPGKIGQALNFDGVDDFVDAANGLGAVGSPQGLDDLGPMTVSAWINPDSAGEQNLGLIAGKVVGATSAGRWGLFLDNSNGGNTNALRFIKAGATDLDVTTTANAFSLGVWRHVVVTWDGSVTATNVHIYTDGIERSYITQTNGATLASDADLPFIIGNAQDTTFSFDGRIDDVRVYNRALTADEIKRLYRIGATLHVNTQINNDSLQNGLVGYWSFNGPDVAGTTAYDRSGQEKNGSFLGQDISHGNLSGWWKFDESSIVHGSTVEDSSGDDNIGTASTNDGAGGEKSVTGKINTAFDFDGVDDYVDAGTGLDDLGPMTVSAWINPDSAGEQGLGAIAGKLVGATSAGRWALLLNDDGAGGDPQSLYFFKDGTTDLARITKANIYSYGVWQHVLVTWDGSTSAANVHIYLNGVESSSYLTSNNGATLASDADLPFIIGNTQDTTFSFDGRIDDVRIYKRVLTGAEITQLYYYGLPKFAPVAGKIGQAVDSTQSYVNSGDVSSSVQSFSFWMKTSSSSPTVNLLDLNASQHIKIIGGAVNANSITNPSIFVDGVSGTTVNSGWHHIAVTTGTAVNASAVNLGLNATTTAPLDGAMDDVRFYNRVLNADEIKRLYRIGATLHVNTQINNDSLSKGLVGWWSFDGKDMAGTVAYDRSGNANNGTLTNGPTRTIGKIGQGLSFDGVDDFVDMPSSSGLGITGNITITTWVKRNTSNRYEAFIAKDADGVTEDYEFGFCSNSAGDGCTNLQDKLNFYVGGASPAFVNSSGTIADSSWHHVAVMRQGSAVTFYIDGQTSGTASMTGTGQNDSSQVWIGKDNVSSPTAGPFDGSIDDVRVYNRVLTADEIKRLYNLGR